MERDAYLQLGLISGKAIFGKAISGKVIYGKQLYIVDG